MGVLGAVWQMFRPPPPVGLFCRRLRVADIFASCVFWWCRGSGCLMVAVSTGDGGPGAG